MVKRALNSKDLKLYDESFFNLDLENPQIEQKLEIAIDGKNLYKYSILISKNNVIENEELIHVNTKTGKETKLIFRNIDLPRESIIFGLKEKSIVFEIPPTMTLGS
jgi:hypothetical protein